MSEHGETDRAGEVPRERGAGDSAAPPSRDAAPELPTFAIVGIGASACALEALRSLLGALPADTGLAYVVVQRLSPEHPSILAKTLTRFTSMPVIEIENGTQLAPNGVYVMPSNPEVLLSRGVLRLVPRPPPPGSRFPIDGLFRSLAAGLHGRAIGVVLSGTGEDGAGGLKEIKAEGGFTYAQTPTSTQFSGIPESAFAAGVVDRVLPPAQIAAELARLSQHPYVAERPPGEGEAPQDRDGTSRIISLVRRHSGVDFSVYKPSTVGRRIARRMALHPIASISAYGDLVERDPAEARALSQDVLIHVTGFFRDPEVFEALERTVFPALLEKKREGPLRIWVPGCSSGEEVYSLAMSLVEHQSDASREMEFQIFGSDLGDQAIERARTGLYPDSALRDLREDRLQRFFTRAGEEQRIAMSIRDRCVFVVHDLARDPPFAQLDLISCRNVLISFGEEVHERLVSTFHSCLNRPGFLVLGLSESVASFEDLFEPVDLEHRIFARVGEGRRIASPPLTMANRTGPASASSPARQSLSRAAARGAAPRPPEPAGGDPVSEARRLREELAATKQYLEAMIDALRQTVRDAQSARDYACAIVESVQVPLLVLDDHQRVVSSNPAFVRVLGAGAPLGVGDDLFARSGRGWDLEPLRRAVEDILAGRSSPPPVEVERDLPGLEKRTFAVTVRRVTWAGGRTAALLAFEDLTEQRRLEEGRTARAVAERSSRTMDLFLATLSHELRTPLSTVLMQAQALRRAQGADSKVGHASAAIERAATLQKKLIDDLLDASRLVSGKLQLYPHAVDLAAIVEGAVEDARPAAAAKAIALNATIAPGVTLVYADPTRIKQIVSKLLSNAIKFTPRGGTVSLTLARSAAQARITVQDTGVGVSPEFLPLLFSRFTQADGSATRAHGGLGLGLAIVKHLVDLHGGSVGADSAGAGRGATFWVTLPLVEAPTPE